MQNRSNNKSWWDPDYQERMQEVLLSQALFCALLVSKWTQKQSTSQNSIYQLRHFSMGIMFYTQSPGTLTCPHVCNEHVYERERERERKAFIILLLFLSRLRLLQSPSLLAHDFSRAVDRLPRKHNSEEYQHFINTYGTHYISHVQLGGRVRHLLAMRTCTMALWGFTASKLKDCLNLETSVGHDWLFGSFALNSCLLYTSPSPRD